MYETFRQWVLSGLRQWVAWIDPPPPPPPVTPVVTLTVKRDDLLMRAIELVIAAEKIWVGGEARRHQVLARLMKEFPGQSKRSLALAIEAAVSEKV